MNAKAQTTVHVSLEMTRQERDEIVAWLEPIANDVPVGIAMLKSILTATETSTDLPVSHSEEYKEGAQ